MLSNRCVARQTIRQVGISRTELRKEVEVFYDRDYVLAKLLIDIIQPLNITSLERLIALVTDAWNEIEVIKSVDYDQSKAG